MPSQRHLATIIDQVQDIIDELSEYDELFVSLELAYQLKGELMEHIS